MKSGWVRSGKALKTAFNKRIEAVRPVACLLFLGGYFVIPARAQISFWTNSTVPGTVQMNDTAAVTLGLNFYSDTAGTVTAVRFYKSKKNTGTHVGTLWTSSGSMLETVTFSGETASGWQQANFATPVSIQAGVVYVVSYFNPMGEYSDDRPYSWSSLNASPLHVSGTSPGVYAYGTSNMFPSSSYDSSNYYVDLEFVPAVNGSGYSISGTVSGSAANLTLSGASSAVAATGTGGTYNFSGLANGSYVVAPSQTGYTFSPSTASATVKGGSVAGVNFTATKLLSHTVSLTWTASVSPNINGYKVYRGTASGGPYTLLTGSLLAGTAYTDTNVTSGQTYYYVTTAVNSSNVESGYSNVAMAAVPTP